ncbi:MAG: selenide, water dikinase SelD [Planctomycetes bacterium]|nr:selenide, water dikinase SelD [Planctomycetota bacterium]
MRSLVSALEPRDERVLVGLDDDAGVVLAGEGLALVQTLDFITPICEDPYTYGQVAAANSLSDVYAMGGTVLSAMNICCFPAEGIPTDHFAAILRGGKDKVEEAGGVLVGGHTVRDTELKFGCSVTGTIDRDRIWRKGGARPGDRLILTKPLGTGVMITASKKGVIDDATFRSALENMARLNRTACETARGFEVHAATDITGFGLAGHAQEMAVAGRVTFRLRMREVPSYPVALDLIRQGVRTGVTDENRAYVKDRVRVEAGARDLEGLAYDPQTSGGLLLAVPAGAADGLCSRLRSAGAAAAAVIGEVAAGGPAVVLE